MRHRRPGAASYVLAICVAALAAGSNPLRAQERERGADLLARVARAYDEFSYDSARTLALRLLSPEVVATPNEKAQAAFYMAGTYLNESPPKRVDARRAMAAGLRASVFTRPDTSLFAADVLQEYERARSALFAVGVRGLPPDTVLGLEGAMVGMEVGGTRPATIGVVLESASGTRYQFAGDVHVVGSGRVPLQFAPNGAFLPTGSYVLTLEATDDSAGARTVVTVPVSINADTVAVQALPDTLATAAFRPERRPWGPARRAALGGLFVGALTAGASQLLTPPTLRDAVGIDVRALGAGAFVAVSGFVVMIAARPGAVLPENVTYNAMLREQWTQERDRIVAANTRLRGEARIRLQFGRPSQ
jgi:hypothetical protein